MADIFRAFLFSFPNIIVSKVLRESTKFLFAVLRCVLCLINKGWQGKKKVRQKSVALAAEGVDKRVLGPERPWLWPGPGAVSSRSHALHPQLPGCTAASGWQQLEGKQEPDDPAPAVGSGGFGGPRQTGEQGGKPSVGALLCVVSAGREPCRAAARQLRLPGLGGQVQLPARWQRHASPLSVGSGLTEADTPVGDCTSLSRGLKTGRLTFKASPLCFYEDIRQCSRFFSNPGRGWGDL